MRALTAPTAVVAEDEETLRHELVEQLGRLWPELSIVGEAADGIQALRLLDQHRPDVLFLDIQMPGATGLDVARQVGNRSHVVFLTAYDQYAVAAFDQGAVDYVLKPLATARLFTAISRVKQRLASPSLDYAQHMGRAVEQLSTRTGVGTESRSFLRWINASVGQSLKLITVDEVLYFQSDNKYTRVATREGEALIRKPLKELLDELDPSQFWQVHRSTLVNATAIAAVTRDFRGRMQLKLKERNEMLLVAESYAHLFRQM
ncbi:MAG: response regulator transcription factor [Paucibacter sp.]|nr:response regulator transcription factor [Roseateles sp.]